MRKSSLYHLLARIVFFIIFSLAFKGLSQTFNPIAVDGLSTGSVYDLMADSKGFIWIAHETGISRFDGNNFTHFHSDEQTSLATTDIIEDKQGRVWCHNFNGQLFYIEHEKMNLLKAYDNKEQTSFQRLTLLNDELLATSDKGLFICNTNTLQCHTVTCNKVNSNYIRTVAVSGKRAIALGEKWFVYEKGTGLRLLKHDVSLNSNAVYLQPLITNDTMYAIEISVATGKWCATKLLLKNDSIIVAGRICFENKINTITQSEGQIFINTSTQTELTNGRVVAYGFDLTDRVADRQGNHWYASLQKGFLFERTAAVWEKIDLPEVKQGDYIRSLTSTKDAIVCGTNNGYVISKNIKNGKVELNVQIPQLNGAVLNMTRYCDNILIIIPNRELIFLDHKIGKFRELHNQGTIKNLVYTDKAVFVASSDSLVSIPVTPTIAQLFNRDATVDLDATSNDFIKMRMFEKAIRRKRCRDVCYDKENKILYASFMDGIYSWQKDSAHLVKYKDEPASALAMVEATNKIILSTLQGVFFLDKEKVIPIDKINNLKTDMITALKSYKDYLFLIEKDALQVFNINTQNLVSTIPLPENYKGLAYTIEVVDYDLYLASPVGLYKINISSLSNTNEKLPLNYLLSVTANDSNITFQNNISLRTSENNLDFTFASPGYIFPSHTAFYYQLKGSNDTSWHKMKEAEFTLSFASLKPGDYTLNAYAVDYRMQKAKVPLSFHFTIKKPWWQHAWFIALVFAFTAAALYFIILYRFNTTRKRTREKELRQQQFETTLLQSQIVVQEQERKRIAEDLHDDIGATLSALHLHISNIPEQTLVQLPELEQFYQQSLLLALKAANDVRSISHDLLPKDFSELGLFAVLQNRIDELNATRAIQFTFITDGNEKLLNNIYSVTIYRIINELISNIIKHSQAQQALIQILITDIEVQIMAEDNGIGIHTLDSKRGIGMKNIQSRTKFLKGNIHVDSSEKGSAIIITIPIDLKTTQ